MPHGNKQTPELSANLILRFLLELAALITLAAFGWHLGEGVMSYLYATGLPLVAATAWGLFAVPGDMSRSGNAPVPVPGFLRLLIELGIFASAAFALLRLNHPSPAWIFALAVAVHYAISYRRILWLLGR